MKPLTESEAVAEARRCLDCTDAPCSRECPAGVDVRRFIAEIRTGNFFGAERTVRSANPLALSCAYICPIERQCVSGCMAKELVYPIAIDRLQEFVARRCEWKPSAPEPEGKAAIVGGGPAGLACAAALAQGRVRPTIFERRKLGGILAASVPPFRLPAEVLQRDIDWIVELGVEWKRAPAPALDILLAEHDRLFVAPGLGRALSLDIAGVETVTAIDFLERARNGAELDVGGEMVVVLGGGGVAMDAAVTAARSGAVRVDVLCLEGPKELPAPWEDFRRAWAAGAIFHTRAKVVAAEDGYLVARAIEWERPGAYVPANAREMEGTEMRLRCDLLVQAVGQAFDDEARKLLADLESEDGRLKVDPETGRTSNDRVYAGGDAASASKMTAAWAVGSGVRAARAMLEA